MKGRSGGIDRTLWPAVLGLAGALAGFEFTGLDLWLQDFFYDAATGRWVVDAADPLGRVLFYTGPKVAFIIPLGIAVLALALGPARWRERLRFGRRDVWVAFLTMATVPILAGLGKKHSDVFCPSEIRRYGGDVPYVKLCEPFPAGDRPERRGHCFPAGHASGGFALLGLYGLRRTRAWRRGVLALGLGLGWWMGGYQMLKGAHYLSHTVVTMLVAWIILLLWRRVVRPEADGERHQ